MPDSKFFKTPSLRDSGAGQVELDRWSHDERQYHRNQDAADDGDRQWLKHLRAGTAVLDGEIVTLDENAVVRKFVEKPLRPSGNWAFAGVMVAGPELLNHLPRQRPADIGFDVLPKMVGKMAGYAISEYLLDIGTISNHQHAQQSWPGLAKLQSATRGS